jgi:hypothetical protein
LLHSTLNVALRVVVWLQWKAQLGEKKGWIPKEFVVLETKAATSESTAAAPRKATGDGKDDAATSNASDTATTAHSSDDTADSARKSNKLSHALKRPRFAKVCCRNNTKRCSVVTLLLLLLLVPG